MSNKSILLLLSALAIVVVVVGIPAALYVGWQLAGGGQAAAPSPPVIIPPSGSEPTPAAPVVSGSIAGLVWHDVCDSSTGGTSPGCIYAGQTEGYQGNGIPEAGEPGISGVYVSIGSGACPSASMGGVSSSADGSFVFSGLNPGTYCITVDQSSGVNAGLLIPGRWTSPAMASSGALASYTVLLTPGQVLTGLEFGWDHQFQPLPQATAQPTNTPPPTVAPTPTAMPVPCNWAQFVADVSVPDGTFFTSGTTFTKTWRLKNIGSCSWNTDYDLVFVSGDAMTGKTAVALPGNVSVGSTVDVSVKLTAPNKAGTYKGYWMLRNASGGRFGIGPKADEPMWVQIRVVKPDPDFAYDFAANMCAAVWRSQDGKLPCPGSSSSKDGFVQLLTSPSLENRNENEPALWTHPDNDADGFISGTYPFYTVQNGDHFIAAVGCLADSKGCNVTFKLQYRVGNGPLQLADKWVETYDGNITYIDLDLSSLSGQKVQFVLTVMVRGGDPVKANAFWFVPRIENLP